MSEPFAALILIGQRNNSVLCLLGILRYASKDIIHLPAPESHKLLCYLSPMCMYKLQSSFVFLPILTISVSELSISSMSVCSSSVFMFAPPNSSVSLN